MNAKLLRYWTKLVFVLVFICSITQASAQQTEGSKAWTDEEHPTYIKRLTHFGERADFSHDGTKILFLNRTFGDAYELELKTGIITPLTHHYYHGGYTRALYLANGDILLSGTRQFNPEESFEWRRFRSELWVLDKSLKEPAVRLGTYCFEGPAISRTRLRVAWTQNWGFERKPVGYFAIWVADIDYSTGRPLLLNQRMVIDNTHPDIEGAILETQNFRPTRENELIFQSTLGVETFGVDIETGELFNYTNAPETHEEPEGAFPDGNYTLVESDRESTIGKWAENVDFYRLKLDGSGEMVRLTFFAESGRFKGTNPVVSDDGRFIAFQVPSSTLEAGVGQGIYLYDIEMAREAGVKPWISE
ncbi:MAG: hypothetical protein GY790_17720 [Bacteroidetes bacterium]|nr:hypothetical protein [Bacteroidota bacterium]